MPRQLRVLIVEDYVDAGESVKVLVELWGHQAQTAETGDYGLKLAQNGEQTFLERSRAY